MIDGCCAKRVRHSNHGAQAASEDKQGSLLGHCWPMLAKPVSAAGKYADVLGKFWDKCPAADKAKIFKCLVIEFKAIHDFGGVKGAGMLLKDL